MQVKKVHMFLKSHAYLVLFYVSNCDFRMSLQILDFEIINWINQKVFEAYAIICFVSNIRKKNSNLYHLS